MGRKVALVIDEPSACVDCILSESHAYTFSQEIELLCVANNKKYTGCKTIGQVAIGDKPTWCPLKVVPGRIPGADKYHNDYEKGWNACIETMERRND